MKNDIFCFLLEKELLSKELVFESDNFMVLHDAFPLVEAHLLIIPKFHVSCYALLEKKWLKEYITIRDRAFDFVKKEYGSFVAFEHGGILQTVKHAHLHILPTSLSVLDKLVACGKEVTSRKSGYLYYFENGKEYYFSPSKELPDGYLQIVFGKLLKRPLNADKRKLDFPGWYLSTKRRYKHYVQE